MKRTILTLSLLVALCSCVKDVLYVTPHPTEAALVVETDWSGCSADAILPQSYILRVGSQEQTVEKDCNVFSSLLTPGKQTLLVYNKPEGMTIDGNTATVNTLQDGTLECHPDFLFSGYQELDIPQDDTLKVVIPMKQHLRTLTLSLKLNPGDEKIIAGTSAFLTGIAPSLDLVTGELTAVEGGVVTPVFSLETEAAMTRATETPVLASSLRMLGIMDHGKQELSISIVLTNGTVQTIKTDLTEYLKNFGSGELEPLVLDATLTLPPEAGVSATITDWNVVNNGDINIK